MAQASYWTVEEVDLSQDSRDWRTLTGASCTCDGVGGGDRDHACMRHAGMHERQGGACVWVIGSGLGPGLCDDSHVAPALVLTPPFYLSPHSHHARRWREAIHQLRSRFLRGI